MIFTDFRQMDAYAQLRRWVMAVTCAEQSACAQIKKIAGCKLYSFYERGCLSFHFRIHVNTHITIKKLQPSDRTNWRCRQLLQYICMCCMSTVRCLPISTKLSSFCIVQSAPGFKIKYKTTEHHNFFYFFFAKQMDLHIPTLNEFNQSFDKWPLKCTWLMIWGFAASFHCTSAKGNAISLDDTYITQKKNI